MRKYLVIAAGAIVIIGVGVAVYFYFFTGSSPAAVTPGTTLTPAGNIPVGGGMGQPISGSMAGTAATRVTSRLVRIDAGPVVPGAVAVDVTVLPGGVIATSTKQAASSTPDVAVRYIRRASGNTFQYLERAGIQTRTSNRTLPGIEEASWLPDGSMALVRYLSGSDFSTVNTYVLPANGVGGRFLAQNLAKADATGGKLLTLASGTNGSVVSTQKPDGSASAQVFATPLSMLRVSPAGKGYGVFTKPASTLDGFAYLVDPAGNFSRVAGPHTGLIALFSPAGNWVLISWSAAGVLKMELVNTQTHVSTTLPVATLADKCAWTSDESAVYCGIPINPATSAAYPDDWYQGALAFSDRVWKIDVAGRLAELTLDFTAQTNLSLDAEALTIDPSGALLVFVNKNDSSLWSYRL